MSSNPDELDDEESAAQLSENLRKIREILRSTFTGVTKEVLEVAVKSASESDQTRISAWCQEAPIEKIDAALKDLVEFVSGSVNAHYKDRDGVLCLSAIEWGMVSIMSDTIAWLCVRQGLETFHAQMVAMMRNNSELN